jgi:hypothetical protein
MNPAHDVARHLRPMGRTQLQRAANVRVAEEGSDSVFCVTNLSGVCLFGALVAVSLLLFVAVRQLDPRGGLNRTASS